MNRRRGVIVQIISSYSNTLFAIFSGLFFVPLYFKFFSVSVYGAWLASGNILNLLGMLEGGVTTVVGQKLAVNYSDNDLKEFSRTSTAGISLMAIVFIAIVTLAFLLLNFIPHWVKVDEQHFSSLQEGLLFAAFGVGFTFLNSPLSNVCKAWHLNDIPAIVTFISAIIGLISIYVGLYYFDMNVAALGFGAMMRSLINLFGTGLFVMIVWKKKNIPGLIFSKSETSSVLKKSAPIFLSTVASAILNNSKEFVLAVLLNPASVAVLSITGRIYSLVTMLVNPICLSAFSALASLSSQIEKFKQWVIDLNKFHNLISSLLFGIALSLNVFFVSVWVGIDKYGGLLLSVLTCLSSWLITKCNLYVIILNAKAIFNKTAWVALLDLSLRALLVIFFFYANKEFKVYYLPLIECITLVISVLWLDYLQAKKIFKLTSKFSFTIKSYLNYIIVVVITGILIDFLLSRYLLHISNWPFLILSAFIITIIYSGLFLLNKNNRVFVKHKFIYK